VTKPKAQAPAAAKPAAKSAQSKVPATKSPAKPADKTPPKADSKASTKPTATPASQAAAQPAPKPAAKAIAKPAAKPAPKSAPEPAPPTPSKPAAKPVSDSVLKPTTEPTVVPAAKVATKPAAKPATRSSTRGIPPVAPASPPSNRFTDRFAPARQVRPPDPIEVQKTSYKADPKLVNAWKTKSGRDLSVPELLAMPDSEYMNEKQVDFFRSLLRTQRDELLSNAGETTEHLREDTTIVPDPADRATIEEEHALELRTRDRERKLLKKISQSLTRLDSNEYGFCDETGEPIGLARLLARPTATLSLEAQQRRELKQKMFGD